MLNSIEAQDCDEELLGQGMIDEKDFRYRLNLDGCGNDKLAEGIRAFIGETDKLEAAVLEKIRVATSS